LLKTRIFYNITGESSTGFFTARDVSAYVVHAIVIKENQHKIIAASSVFLILTREHIQLLNRFSLDSIAIRSVLVSSEKAYFGFIFRSFVIDLWAFYWIFGL
jgi:hypothetical protein